MMALKRCQHNAHYKTLNITGEYFHMVRRILFICQQRFLLNVF